MKDHGRMLGTLFIAWGIAQLVGAVVVVAMTGATERPPAMFWVFAVLAAAAYSWIGTRLRVHDPRVRMGAIILCALALLSFPVGTVLGGYGLWVLLKRKALTASP